MLGSEIDFPRYSQMWMREVGRGNVNGASPVVTYGRRTTTGAEDNVLWPNGTYVVPPSTGAAVSFVSDSANDDVGGTGINSVEVHYLDGDLREQRQTVELNGLTEVTDAILGVRAIQCMHMVTYGSGKAADGNISAYEGANTYSYIEAGKVRCSSSVRMVPAGKRFLVLAAVGGVISGTAASQGTVQVAATRFDGHDYTDDSIFFPVAEMGFQDGSFGINLPVPAVFYEGAAVGMTFSVDKAATITGALFGVVEDAE